MAIDKDTARRVAHLARIEVAEAELEHLAGELSSILGFMEQLREVDVAGVEPMTSVTPMRLPWREDVVTDGGIPDKVLANAPDARVGFFTVPKVVE
jgi:aspartyl-tRNA(Asn)/glutamyl-tRNA(Gln) amidotransferase subunit C